MYKYLLPLLFCTGCYKLSYVQDANVEANGPGVTKKHHTFLLGLVEPKHVNINSLCPGGFTKIEQKKIVIDAFLGLIVGNLIPIIGYYPQTVTVHCASSAAYELKMDNDFNIKEIEAVARN